MAFFVTLLIYAALFIAAELLKPKPNIENARPSSIDEFNVPTATEGRHWPLLWGTNQITGANVIDYGGLETRAVTEKIKTGMFSKKKVDVAFDYFLSIQFGLCLGPLSGPHDGLVRILVDDDIIFDPVDASSPADPDDALADGVTFLNALRLFGEDNGGIGGNFRMHPGTLTQGINQHLLTLHPESPTFVPAYRGFAYGMAENIYVGRSPSLRPWKFVIRRIPDGLDLISEGTPSDLVNGLDANPANVLYEVMTEPDWGLGIGTADINEATFVAAGNTLFNEGNGFSMMLETPREAISLINEIERQADGILTRAIDGRWEFNLVRETDVPSPESLMPLIDESNSQVVDFGRGSWDETVNQVRVQFTNSSKQFVTNFALAQDMANQRIQSANVVVTQQYPGVKNKTLANKLAWRDIKTLATPLAKATIKLNREHYDIRPGDLIRLTWGPLGITELRMRVNKLAVGDLEDNRMTLDVVQDIFSAPQASFGDPIDTGWTPPTETPTDLDAIDKFIFETPFIMIKLDPDNPNIVNRVTAVARNTSGVGAEWEFLLRTKSTPLVGAEPYISQGVIPGYCDVGTLRDGLEGQNSNTGGPVPPIVGTEDFDVDPVGGINLFTLLGGLGIANATDIANLRTLVYVAPATVDSPDFGRDEGEFIVYQEISLATGSPTGASVKLTNCFRGALDTAVRDHPVGSRVWFLGLDGAGISVDVVPQSATSESQGKILPSSRSEGALAEGSATPTNRLEGPPWQRSRQPLSPTEVLLNSQRYPAGALPITQTPQTVSYTRRNWRTIGVINSVLGNDDGGAAFVPGASSVDLTQYNYEILDASGSPHESGAVSPNALHSGSTPADDAGNDEFTFTRADILTVTGDAFPDRLRFVIEAGTTIPDDSQSRVSWQPADVTYGVTWTELPAAQFLGFIPYNTIDSPQFVLEASPGFPNLYFEIEDGPLDATGAGDNGKMFLYIDDASPRTEVFGIASPMPLTAGPFVTGSPSNWSTVRIAIQHFHNTGKRRLVQIKTTAVSPPVAWFVLVPNTET